MHACMYLRICLQYPYTSEFMNIYIHLYIILLTLSSQKKVFTITFTLNRISSVFWWMRWTTILVLFIAVFTAFYLFNFSHHQVKYWIVELTSTQNTLAQLLYIQGYQCTHIIIGYLIQSKLYLIFNAQKDPGIRVLFDKLNINILIFYISHNINWMKRTPPV